MKQVTRIFFLILSLLSGGFVYQEIITVGIGFISFYFVLPCFLISSLLAILITTKSKLKYLDKRIGGFVVWLTSIIILVSILSAINTIRNLTPVLISTKFYWEEGVDFEFRKNGTFKSINHDILSSNLSYGKYILKDSLIILKDKVKFGMEYMSDTLIISKNGISFNMDKPWRISEGIMSYQYSPETELMIINNTNYKVDSIEIKLSYTDQNTNSIDVKPNQKIKYLFNMTNQYVNGEYILYYKIKDQSNQIKKIMNILNGYPLGTVTTIQFENDCIRLNLIFGNSITLNYS